MKNSSDLWLNPEQHARNCFCACSSYIHVHFLPPPKDMLLGGLANPNNI